MKKLNELLGTEFPIIQGGMANIATGPAASADPHLQEPDGQALRCEPDADEPLR